MALKATKASSGLVNARPRFGLEDGKLFDYKTSRYLPPNGNLSGSEGTWDLAKVAALLESGDFIETAFTPAGSSPPKSAPPADTGSGAAAGGGVLTLDPALLAGK